MNRDHPSAPLTGLPKTRGGFRTVVADPPWPETGPMHLPAKTRDVLPLGTPYERMTYDDIKALPVEKACALEGHLYLWATQRSLRTAFEVVEAWGFDNKAVLTWAKRGLGMGFRYFRHSSEFVLFGTRSNLATNTNNTGTHFTGKKGAHSVKPDEFYRMVEANSPGPYLELFARVRRPGWRVWGNEAPR